MGDPKDDRTITAANAKRSSSGDPAPVPAIIGKRYEVLSLLGAGGMGAVYRVHDRELEEIVALKMLRRELGSDPAMMERFRREVKAARKVTSEHVARVYDIGEHEGERYLTMEVIDGASLATEIAEHATGLPLARAKTIASHLCRGLAAAHAVGVVHRDLKPDNVLLASDGTAKITDFGIAKVATNVRITQGQSPGTPAYMAPEQVDGRGDVDARSDLYALGTMLYEMLTGALPWRGRSGWDMAMARLDSPAPDVRQMNTGVPDALAELVLALMARDRDDRPKSATDVLAALDAIDVSADAAKPAGAPRAHAAKATLVLVLPFDAGGDAYLAQAVTDAVIDALSTSRGLRVFARGAAATHAGKEPREAGAELGADAVVHGSIERAGDDLRVQARVVGVADGLLLRSVRFTRANGDLLSAGGEIARNVAAALDVDAAPKPLGARDPQIVDLYVRARHDYFAGSDRSLTLFKQALDRAPDDPLVLAGYALARVGMRVTPSDLAETARIAARAVELAPDLAEAHLAAGHLALHQGRATDAARAIRRALDIAPSNGDAHLMIGRLFGECSAIVPAMTHIEIACRIDPTLAGSTMELARLRALLGAWKEVDALVEKLRPAPLLYWQCVIRFALWRNDEATLGAALAAVRAGELRNHPLVQSVVRFVDGSSLEIAAPDATARRIVFGHQLSAEVASLRGSHDDALEHIERAANAGLFDLAWLDHCAALVPVRANRRFSVARHAVAARVEEILEALG